jgi:hypothetical protein
VFNRFENETAGCPLLLNSKAKVQQDERREKGIQVLQVLVQDVKMRHRGKASPAWRKS